MNEKKAPIEWSEIISPGSGTKIKVPKKATYSPDEITPKFPVPGLKAYDRVRGMIHYEWKPGEAIDESDARDAQCRAGWNDIGYGFFGFHFENGLATWQSGARCD